MATDLPALIAQLQIAAKRIRPCNLRRELTEGQSGQFKLHCFRERPQRTPLLLR